MRRSPLAARRNRRLSSASTTEDATCITASTQHGRLLNKKAKKTDIAAIEYALADLDPKDGETSDAAKEQYLSQLEGVFAPKPTAIVDSGNGIQCLWKLKKPIVLGRLVDGKFSSADKAKIDDVEARVEADGAARQQGGHAEHRPHPTPAGHHQPAEQEEAQGGSRRLPDAVDQVRRHDVPAGRISGAGAARRGA